MIVAIVGAVAGLHLPLRFLLAAARTGSRRGAEDRRGLVDGALAALFGCLVAWAWVPWTVVPPLAWALPVALTAAGVMAAGAAWGRLPWVAGAERRAARVAGTAVGGLVVLALAVTLLA